MLSVVRVRWQARSLALVAAGTTVCGLITGCGNQNPPSKGLRPLNVLIVTIDTLRADHVGCYGYSKAETPNLDRVAASGALFENAIAQAPLTPPSHASIFTGLNPTAHRVRDIGGFVLSPSHQTLATILHNAGRTTAAFVGASVLKRQSGLDQGFDLYDDQMPVPEPGTAGLEYAERPAGAVVDRALAWLKQQQAVRPWFLWVHVYDPHAPHEPPPEFRNRFQDRPYDGEIAYADRELARLFNNVKGAIVAVLSDHGKR
jgi:arylsulfatase A-like enzyme